MASQWSEWTWDLGRSKYYRYRTDENGLPQYEVEGEGVAETPRTIGHGTPGSQHHDQAAEAALGSAYTGQYTHSSSYAFSTAPQPAATQNPYIDTPDSRRGNATQTDSSLSEPYQAEPIEEVGLGLQKITIRGDETQLDKEFQVVEPKTIKDFFIPGRVFALLWTEPSSKQDTELSDALSTVTYGETAYSEIRRFIAVICRSHHSLCVPISTYGGQATVKRKHDREHHSIAYIGACPPPLQGEKLTKEPICVIPYGDATLKPESRINFSKVYTVEHNVKVKAIGFVEKRYFDWVRYYFKGCTNV